MRAQAKQRHHEARELFLHLYSLRGRAETRLSAANMTLRMGETAAALAEYETLERRFASRLGSKALQVRLLACLMP